MARPGPRRSQAQSDRLFELGVQGRKTGVTLKDSGVRDEHGMEPLDDIFSSPLKENSEKGGEDDDDEDDEEESGMAMEIDHTGGASQFALLNRAGNRMSLPLPRSRSPPKTYLQSPAQKNPHLQQSSSPSRGTVVREIRTEQLASVSRKLDFGSAKMPKFPANDATLTNGFAGANGHAQDDELDPEEEEAILNDQLSNEQTPNGRSDDLIDIIEDSLREDGFPEDSIRGASVPTDYPDGEQASDDDDDDAESLAEEYTSPAVQKAGRNQRVANRSAKRLAPVREANDADDAAPDPEVEPQTDEDEPARPRRRGGAKKGTGVRRAPEPEPEPRPRKRRSLRSSDAADDIHDDSGRGAKRQRTETVTKPRGRGRPPRRVPEPEAENGSEDEPEPEPEAEAEAEAPSKAAPVKGKRGRKPKVAADADTSLLVPRGPPVPKKHGLVINRPVVSEESSAVLKTRSGRSSYKPLAFWRGEHVDYEYEYANDPAQSLKAYMPSIKGVYRVEEEQAPAAHHSGRPGRRAKGRGRPKKNRRGSSGDESSDDEPLEPWERDPGAVSGDMVQWKHEYLTAPPALSDAVDTMEQQVALSDLAIRPKTVRDANFRYLRTVSMPFFGAGVLELAPGTEKRPKSSRRMVMTFFVQYGRVQVNINDTVFRIGKGGMFFVPRANYYTIINDYDKPARLFFSQACEMSANLDEEPQMPEVTGGQRRSEGGD